MAESTTRDMTQGNPVKLILAFALPMLLGLLFQQFYSMVDTIIVGKWLGVDALAAVGSTGSINFMIIGFCMGVCNGFAIPVAQRFGSKDYVSLRRFVANSVWVSAVFAAVMTVAVCVLCMPILKAMNTPDNIIDQSYDYIFVIFLGIPVTYLYNLLSGIIRSLGDSRTPVYFLILSSMINILLDIVSIRYLHMGVAGPAWATVISQAVSGLLCLVYIHRKFEILHLRPNEWRPDGDYIHTLLFMGVPMGLQYSITAIGSVILQTAVNGLGSAAVATVTAGSKMSMFFCCPFDALGGTIATYAGQNVGAKQPQRIDSGIKAAVLIGFAYSLVACAILTFFGDTIALLFLDADETAILSQVHRFVIANSAFYMALTLVNVVRFCIQGMGFSVFAILAGVCEMIARTIMGFGVVPLLGFGAVCFANPLAWVMADAFLIPAYLICRRRLRKMFGQTT
ncbi:MAG: MATE family efflux transporter [Clostridium sp.]|nr:MATE family efflux transporter [Acetatifactor muris]MCM1528069.1 MATE family efflux transporter [Bacteroides sp.]MCM1564281.1 MATE family efflux transporter [Clostridium sp.]